MANWRQATETSASNEAQCALLAGNHLACRRLISPSAAEMTDKRNSFPGCFIEAVSRWNEIISGIGCLAVNSLDSLFQPLGMPNPRHPETREMAIKVLRSSLSGFPPPLLQLLLRAFGNCSVIKAHGPYGGIKKTRKQTDEVRDTIYCLAPLEKMEFNIYRSSIIGGWFVCGLVFLCVSLHSSNISRVCLQSCPFEGLQGQLVWYRSFIIHVWCFLFF